MKKFRIVTDSFSGYEAQVKYAFFPFKWFQLNDYKGVNTFCTAAEAIEFINQKRSGLHKKLKAQRTSASVDYQVEFKCFLKTGKVNTDNVVWQERFMDYLLRKNNPTPVAGMIMASSRQRTQEVA